MPRGRQGSTTRGIGYTSGGRGPLPSNIVTQSDYYNSGRGSALNPMGAVRDSSGKTLKSGGTGSGVGSSGKSKK